MRGKTKFFLKTVLDLTLFVQNTQLLQLNWPASKSPKWVAKIPWTKFLKILSKYFLQLEGLSVSESWNLLCKLATRASTRDQVTKMSRENDKNSEISKYFLSVFHNWGTHSLESHESFWVSSQIGPRDWHDSRVSHQNKVVKTKFGFFEIFQNKTLSKNN